MLQFPPSFAGRNQKMCRILVPKNSKGFVELGLFDLAMGCQVFACWAVVDEIVLDEEALCSRVIPRGEVDLGKPESIIGIS